MTLLKGVVQLSPAPYMCSDILVSSIGGINLLVCISSEFSPSSFIKSSK